MLDILLSTLIAPAFRPLHEDLKASAHNEYWLKGGRGSGKSSFISLEIALGVMRYPDANAVIYRKVADTLRDSVFAQMLWAIERLGVSSLWQRRLSPMELVFVPNGQRVLFRGADDPQRSKGLKPERGYFRYLWLEELTEFSGLGDLRTLKASVLRGEKATTFCSFNPPESASNWVNAEALRPRADRLIHHSDFRDLPAGWLGSAFLADARALRQQDERAYRHMYLGEVTGTGGQVFPNLEFRAISDDEILRMSHFYEGLDLGFWPDPSHWLRVSYDSPSQTVYLLDEIRRFRTLDRELAGLIRQRQGEARPEVIADSASPKALVDLRAGGLRVTGAMKGPGSVAHGLKWLRTRRKIVIDPSRTPHAAREFAQYELARGEGGAFVQRYIDRDNHAIDAARYALNRLWA